MVAGFFDLYHSRLCKTLIWDDCEADERSCGNHCELQSNEADTQKRVQVDKKEMLELQGFESLPYFFR